MKYTIPISFHRGGDRLSVNQADMALDQDWVELITQAKKLGLSLEEIRLFLQDQSEK